MSGIFLDTGYLIALLNKKDNLHKAAVEAAEKYHGPFLTTQLILIELANSLCLPPQKPLAIRMIDKIQADPLTTVIPVTFDRFEKALSLYKKRTDKSWGMIDCFSFIAMDEFGVKQALTFDEHFRQAGYKVPLL
ncbi:MAG: PIN domain-containing protein [Thermodesulfovibrionales bacterium]|nr:PIN domain-containing protein [Nitrospinota bacterium]MDP3048958.1 PIN domain-containing protein [Thermodesulfovibrionales bacterium]